MVDLMLNVMLVMIIDIIPLSAQSKEIAWFTQEKDANNETSNTSYDVVKHWRIKWSYLVFEHRMHKLYVWEVKVIYWLDE